MKSMLQLLCKNKATTVGVFHISELDWKNKEFETIISNAIIT